LRLASNKATLLVFV